MKPLDLLKPEGCPADLPTHAVRVLGIDLGTTNSTVCEALERGMRNKLLQRVKVRQLPPPDPDDMERVPGLPLAEFHRIAVAYGLTVADNFEENLIWPKDIKPHARHKDTGTARPKYEDRYISKDMV